MHPHKLLFLLFITTSFLFKKCYKNSGDDKETLLSFFIFKKGGYIVFVISFISNGELKTTAIRTNADEAVDLGYEWYDLYHHESSDGDYIAIDQQVKGKKENARFAEIRMDQRQGKVMLFLELDENKKRSPIFSKQFTQISKHVLICFLEVALIRLTEYIKKETNPKREDDDY
jgi:hypothetical protein